MERVCGTLEQESSRLTQPIGETIFELFISLKILKGFREFLPLKFVPVLLRSIGRLKCQGEVELFSFVLVSPP